MKIIYDGSMGEKELRNIFRDTLIDMVEKDPSIVYLDADLMGCMGTGPWAKEHPDRAINCGIAEADMVGIACGMAAEGYRPIMHTFGPFASRRCYDQLFLSAGYAGNDVTVVGGDPGVCAALNGGTHMPFEDTGLFRLIPNSTIVEVTDYAILESVMRQLPYLPGVKYIRVDRKKAKPVYEIGGEAPIGKGIVLRDGTDITIVASGIMVQEALEAAKTLEAEGINVVTSSEDEAAAAAQEAAEPELDLSVPEGISIDDPVRMYLKEIGKVPLLSCCCSMQRRPKPWWWRKTTTASAVCAVPSAMRWWKTVPRRLRNSWLCSSATAKWAPVSTCRRPVA